jgi:hypothetical protein
MGLDNEMNAAQVQGPLQFGEPKGLFRMAGVSSMQRRGTFSLTFRLTGSGSFFRRRGRWRRRLSRRRCRALQGWQLPEEFTELRRQMEGRLGKRGRRDRHRP